MQLPYFPILICNIRCNSLILNTSGTNVFWLALNRRRYMGMRRSLVRFRSMVHMYVNRKQYIKVGEHALPVFFTSFWKESEEIEAISHLLADEAGSQEEGSGREAAERDGRPFDFFYFQPPGKERCFWSSVYASFFLFFHSFRSWTRGRWLMSRTWWSPLSWGFCFRPPEVRMCGRE